MTSIEGAPTFFYIRSRHERNKKRNVQVLEAVRILFSTNLVSLVSCGLKGLTEEAL